MYKFTAQEIVELPQLADGIYTATLVDIINTTSKSGDLMLKLLWRIGEYSLFDYILPDHKNEITKKLALNKLSAMAFAMLEKQPNEEFDLADCLYKKAELVIRSKKGTDGNLYPKIAAIQTKKDKKSTQVVTEEPFFSDDIPL